MKMRLFLVFLSDKQLVFGQMFEYFTDCTLGQIRLKVAGENFCHDAHYLKGKLSNNAEREHWRNLRINVFSHPIIDVINRKSVGACVLIIGDIPKKFFPSILKEVMLMAIARFKEQGKVDEFDHQLVFSRHFCLVVCGLNQEEVAKMSDAVMQNQGNLLSGLDYLQQGWSHVRPTDRDKMKNLITYLKNMNVEYKVNMRLDMLTQDGSLGHIHMFN